MYKKKKNDTILRVQTNAELLGFLMAKVGGTRTSLKNLLGRRVVNVNGSVQTRHDTPLHIGDTVTIVAARGNAELKHPKLRIVYEDDDLIVVEKKPGLLTAPVSKDSAETTALSILRQYVRRQDRKGEVYVVHRLDRETSGVLVFAKSQDLREYMRTYWQEIVKDRCYIAVAEGIFAKQEDTITSWFTEDNRNAMVYSSPVDDGGQKAITHYKVIKTMGNYSLVELHLETGRTNQIRVHLASIGHPIVGDRKYGHGNDQSPIDRLALHAREISLIHPVTEKIVRFNAPTPKLFLTVNRHDPDGK